MPLVNREGTTIPIDSIAVTQISHVIGVGPATARVVMIPSNELIFVGELFKGPPWEAYPEISYLDCGQVSGGYNLFIVLPPTMHITDKESLQVFNPILNLLSTQEIVRGKPNPVIITFLRASPDISTK